MKTDERLLNYLDGTLETGERQSLEEALRNDASLQQRLHELKEIHAMLKAVKPEIPSHNFTANIMDGLDQSPARRGLSVWQGLMLLAGIMLIITVAAVLVSRGVFDGQSTLDLTRIGIDSTYVNKFIPTLSLDGKILINVIIVSNLVLAFLVLDRIILRRWFHRQVGY